MTREDAIQQLTTDLDAETEPVLTPTDLGAIVDAAKRWSVWVASSSVTTGQKFVPETWNGRVYKVVKAGTTGAAAPSFPSAGCIGQRVTDGSVTWQDCGPAHTEQYDLRKAKYAGCKLKARRCAALVNIKTGNDSFEMSQRYDHWKDEASKLKGFFAV